MMAVTSRNAPSQMDISSPVVLLTGVSHSAGSSRTDKLLNPEPVTRSNLNLSMHGSKPSLPLAALHSIALRRHRLLHPKARPFLEVRRSQQRVTGGMCACERECECGGIKWRKPKVRELRQVSPVSQSDTGKQAIWL